MYAYKFQDSPVIPSPDRLPPVLAASANSLLQKLGLTQFIPDGKLILVLLPAYEYMFSSKSVSSSRGSLNFTFRGPFRE
jgi:hypothetical protein